MPAVEGIMLFALLCLLLRLSLQLLVSVLLLVVVDGVVMAEG